MRIIAGELRGRRLVAPEGRGTRPMLDRVREAVFGRLHARLPGARVLDLFAGSGSLGLEALSRGAASARLVERGPRALAALKRNVAELGLEERARVVRGDALAPRTWWDADADAAAEPYDLVLLDPPYALLGEARPRVLEAARRLVAEALAPGGLLVLHVPRGRLGPDDLDVEAALEERDYGTSAILYAERAEAP